MMRLTLLSLMVVATSFASGQQISCAKFDEEQGSKAPQYTMKGCRSFNELVAAGGIKITKAKEIKSYACFATTFPEESFDLFVFVELGGIMYFTDDKEHNGSASMKTFVSGVKANDGYTPITWTQYPKENPFLWSDGAWLGHGDAQMTTWSEETKSLVPQPESNWKLMQIPRLHASVEDDTIILNLDINNAKGSVETLRFNRRTGRASLGSADKQQALRCVTIED